MTQEAFKTWWYNEGSQAPYTHHDCEEHTMRMCEIAWNKAAQTLAQPEQEPVEQCRACFGMGYVDGIGDKCLTCNGTGEQPPQPEQEPVAWFSPSGNLYKTRFHATANGEQAVTPLYTTPPQRKPLTNGEIYTAYITATNQTLRATDERLAFAFARAIEAAHGIKE